ncbi:MAG: FHA domain-containing protein, partial [Myxococcales bacterium]|nr:FHA domain-containing protein [Myxococcales bacterium]
MVDTWLPRRTTLRALVAALQEAGLGATTLTYGDLPDVIRVRTEQAKLLGLAVERARELALEGGLPGPWDAEAQRALVAVGLLAARPGRDVLRARTPANVVAGASEVLARARQLAQRLNEEAAEIDSKFIGWRELSAGDLRHHALVIRTTGLLARIFGSKSYRSSRAAYLTLTTGRAAPREAMASALERGAEQLENEAHFVEDPEVRALCGSHFRELSTDFTLIERVNAWALEVEASTHASHPRSRWIRDVLLGGATEWLERVADFLTAEGARVKALVDTTPSDLTEVASTASRTASALAAPHAFMAGHALDARTPLVDLADVSAALDQVADLDARIDAQVVVRSVLGAHWDAAATDLDVVTAAISASATLAEIGLPDDVTTWLLAGELPMRLGEATSLARKMHEALDVEAEGRRAAADSGVAVDLVAAATAPISAARQTLELARAAPAEALAAWLQFVTARRACDDLPALAAFGAAIDRASGRWEALPDLFEWSLLRALGGIAMSSHPQISGGAWSGGRLSQLRDRIRVLSAELADLKRRALAAQLASVVPPRGHGAGARGGWTNDALLRNEIAKKARHIPIRQLMARARDAVLALTPCLMMSPLSVAQFLEDTSFQFDLLVIDEASQLRPEDSLGALLRARQAVVVGDEQQLPPTEFFRRAATDDVDGDDAYAEDLETESVLDLALRVMGDARVLRWHYRSRHDSLIAFSNQNFYDNKLVVAPAPRRAGPGSGVLVRYVKGVYEASTNEREAMAVVEVVVEQMRTHPRRSIGVAALNQAQSDLIRDLLDERLRREETDFVDRWKDTLEAFFVKNLENVQGDERDTIIVSLTYGPDAAGRVYQRFGPINGANGHRRLNVLFSRAKHQLVVVTSLRAEDVKIGPASQRGVQVLRGYLEYAAARAAVSSATSSAAAPGRYARLERDLGSLGLDVETDVGAQTLTLDLGVKHPDARDEFLAGVEVDAGSWMGPARGRDRDGTRRAVLENLGWQVVTTWTTDWMREPGGARRRLFDAINQIAHGAGRALPPAPARVVAHPLDQLPALVAERPATPTLPELEVGVYANGRQHGRYTITADRIRVGRGQHCEVRIPEDFREVSSFHLEMTWESGLLVLADTSSQNGTYINGRRVSREVIPPGRTFSIQIGGGPVALRVLYANDAMAPAADRAPQPPANSSDTAHEAVLGLPARIVAKLDADERQFLSAIRANGAMRLADLVQQLGRSPMRVSGMVRTLRRTLH